MAAALKDIAGFFDIKIEKDEDFDFEAVKKKVQSDFIPRVTALDDEELVGRIVGKRMGSLTTEATQAFKEFGISKTDFKDKTLEEGLRDIAAKVSAQLKTAKESQGGDEAFKKLQVEFDKTKSLLDAEREAKTALEQDRDNIKANSEKTLKQYKVKTLLDSEKSKIEFGEEFGKNKALQLGFESHIGSAFEWDVNDEGALVVMKGGKPIKDTAKAGAFLTPSQVLLASAEELGVPLKKNNATGEKKKIVFQQQADNTEKTQTGRPVNKAAAAKIAARQANG